MRIASQPRVRSMNHQTAIIKVVREDPFFTSQSNVLQSQSGNAQGNNVQVNSVETGTVLSITPQISDDQKITLEILPSVTTLAGTDSFVQPITGVTTNASGDIINSTVQSTNATAPRLRAKQASTVVRVNDRDTVVMGGFIEDQLNQVRKKVPCWGIFPCWGRCSPAWQTPRPAVRWSFWSAPRSSKTRPWLRSDGASGHVRNLFCIRNVPVPD